MHHVLRFALLLCLVTHVVFAAKPDPREASGAGDGPQRLPSIPSSNYPYYQTLRTYSFDNAGIPAPQGWTTHDLTAQYGLFWHVDDFAGLSGYAPLQGSRSMWCGVRPGVLSDPFIPFAPGYGDNWTQILRFPPINNYFPGTRTVRLLVNMSYDMPDNLDRMDIEYRPTAGSGPWNLLGSVTGTAAAADYQWQFTSGQAVEIRFVMTSDSGDSDESLYDTNGAVVLDNIRLVDVTLNSTFYVQDFESFPSGTVNPGGAWFVETPPAFGNYAGVVSGADVYQDGTPNTTGMWSFFNGSTATYACGGHPSQLATPYTQVPGSTRPGDYLFGEIRSPLIDFTVNQNNQPSDPGMGTLAMEFDMYRTTGNFVLPGYRWRFVVNGVLQGWTGSTSFQTLSPSWFSMNTIRFNGGAPIPPGATQVQFSLFASDYEYGGGGTCHTQAPLFDNVRVIRMYNPVRVTNTNNSGVGSMRQAIIDANSNSDMNAMLFFLGNNGPYTINLTSPLPAITGPLWIDGFSQAGSVPNVSQLVSTSSQLKVAMNGASAGANANGLVFAAGSYGVVRGLVIGGFSGAGIRNECTSLIVTGCHIGLDASGLGAGNGIGIFNTSPGMDIGGIFNEERMVISNSAADGIRVAAGGTGIFNCHLGYDLNGFEMANSGEAIHVLGGFNTQIGEPATGDECRGEYTDRVWIEAGNIAVESPASGVMVSQVVIEGGLIDLNYDGPTPNDPGDTDSGANGLQNYPVLTSVGSNTVLGDMDGAPNTPMHIELFSGDGFQAVMHYLGYKDVTTNGSGHASFSFSCAPTAPGANITATATAGANTSEFGPWITYNNTPAGSPVPLVQLYDNSSVLRATVQFNTVSSGGNTFLNPTTPPIAPNPQTWNVGQTPLYWDISTNAVYTGPVHITLYYDPANIPGPENTLRLLHFQNGTWVDVTDSFDFAANWIGGTVTSLSPFVIAKHTNATGVGDTPLPETFALRANVPNPFNPTTTIHYDVRRGGGDVSIMIYDVNGRLVRTLVDEHRAAGRFQIQWNGLDDGGRPVSSGVYFYRMQAGSFRDTRKMVLLK